MALIEVAKNGWPVLLEMGRTLPGAPDTVWRLITDWEHLDDWMLEASGFAITSSHREGLGVEGRATVTIAGVTTEDTVVVTGWDPPHRLAIQHLGWVSGEAEMILTPLGDRATHLFWRENLYPPLGGAGAIGLSVFRPLMKRIFDRDLRVLEGLVRAAESTGGLKD